MAIRDKGCGRRMFTFSTLKMSGNDKEEKLCFTERTGGGFPFSKCNMYNIFQTFPEGEYLSFYTFAMGETEFC